MMLFYLRICRCNHASNRRCKLCFKHCICRNLMGLAGPLGNLGSNLLLLLAAHNPSQESNEAWACAACVRIVAEFHLQLLTRLVGVRRQLAQA